jgi:hypothetical protein
MTAIKDWVTKNGRKQRFSVGPTPVIEDRRLLAFGFTLEQLTLLIVPMVCIYGIF